MDGFVVTAAELQATGSQLAEISGEVRAEVSLLQAEVDGLLGRWQGQAAEGFAQGWQQWRQGANDVLVALAEMGTLLGASGRNYTGSDVGSTATLDSAGGGL